MSVSNIVNDLRYYAGWVTKIEGARRRQFPDTLHYTRREPVGVCALITPWNFPLMILGLEAGAGLGAGNTVVIKPAEQTPLTSIRLAELAEQVGFPPGVVNLVTGDERWVRRWWSTRTWTRCRSPGRPRSGARSCWGPARATSSGSPSRAGRQVPSVIARDADVDAAVGGNLGGALLNSGQVCAAYTRFYVDAKREDEFLTKMAAAVEAMTIGPGLEATTQLGPLVSAQHLDKVTQMVAAGQTEGAELVTGGKRARDVGYFLQPTIFSRRHRRDEHRHRRDFGPVLSVFRYSDQDAAAGASSTGPTTPRTGWRPPSGPRT